MPTRARLPIDPVLPEICRRLDEARSLVLQAEPGAGKTTRVPGALLDAGVAGAGSILVLEPRRVAARAGADYVSSERGEKVGDSVGFQVRFEKRGGADTRVWFLTEGVALRRLVGDPFLEDVGVVVLDEFHERHLAGDIVLAIARELQRTVRPDLKILVMSATLDVDRIASYLDGCPVVRCEGRVHPVATEYRHAERGHWLADRVVDAVRELVGDDDDGDILVFLPGIAEIRRAERALEDSGVGRALDVLTLHGDLSLEAQRRVLRPSPRRRVVLSTNVAESSVTVEGVTAVIDSGLARVPQLDVARGVERLQVAPISVASADQRRGRAGRQAPGRCIRLWSEHEHTGRRAREAPEIRRLDLTSTVLQLRAWGLGDLQSLQWLDAPDSGALAAAEVLLTQLGALDDGGGISDLGRRIIRMPVGLRAARLALEAAGLGYPAEGALAAAILSEREIAKRSHSFAGRESADSGLSDLLLRIEMFELAAASGFDRRTCDAAGIEAGAARAVDRARAQLLRAVGSPSKRAPHGSRPFGVEEALLRSALVAFSDRLVRRRGPGERRGVMIGGTGVALDEASCVREGELFVAIEVRSGPRGRNSEAAVSMASAVEPGWLEEYFGDEIETTRAVEFDESGERAVRAERRSFRGLVLSELRTPTRGGEGGHLLVARALQRPQHALSLSDRAEGELARVDFAVEHGFPGCPEGSNGLLRRSIEVHGAGLDSLAELRRAIGGDALANAMTFAERRDLDSFAPESFPLPSGRVAKIDYRRVGGPTVSARIQELFGMKRSPALAGGTVSLLVEVLGPNHRPVQVTGDLASFWENTYPDIRKELRGRYPKHDWPADPWNAVPSSRVGRRRKS